MYSSGVDIVDKQVLARVANLEVVAASLLYCLPEGSGYGDELLTATANVGSTSTTEFGVPPESEPYIQWGPWQSAVLGCVLANECKAARRIQAWWWNTLKGRGMCRVRASEEVGPMAVLSIADIGRLHAVSWRTRNRSASSALARAT